MNLPRFGWPALAALVAAAGLVATPAGWTQPAPPPLPRGVEVMARGPVHEAFASPTADPVPTKAVPKKPPAPIDELPPAEKPDGDVVWISGYWAWDDDRSDFLWVSGVWRTVPPGGKQWVAGYWREAGGDWQWVPGFWAAVRDKETDQQITYLPEPPAVPEVAPPGQPPTAESFYVPGCWVWAGHSYAWRAGYWARVQPGYVWVPDHYRWTPAGHIFVAGYWDLAMKRRGILYAPVVISPAVVTVGFTYTPAYAVRDTVIVDAMFVRPSHCHYYFGDYYEVKYRSLGYESCVVYSRRRYEPIVVYEVYERRRDPTWVNVQINLYNDRAAGRAPLPPRTLVEQNTYVDARSKTYVDNRTTVINQTTVNNITMIAPPAQVAATKETKLVKLDEPTRQQARQQAQAVQQVSVARVSSEKPLPPGSPRQARTAPLNVPRAQPVKPGMVAPRPAPPAAAARPAAPPSARIDRPVPPPKGGTPAQLGTPKADAKARPVRPATPTPATGTPPRPPVTTPPAVKPPTGATGVKPPTTGTPWAPTRPAAPAAPVRPAAPVARPTPPAPPKRPAPPPARRPPPKDSKDKKDNR